MILAWMTDIHLDFIQGDYFANIMDQVKGSGAEGLIITGDISNATRLTHSLRDLSNTLNIPIYFVLGNHDYYAGSFYGVSERVVNAIKSFKNLRWLTKENIIELTPSTCIIGHDSWYDGGYGNYKDSRMLLNDFECITDLLGKDKNARLKVFENRSKCAVDHLNKQVPIAANFYENIIFATHVPPFKEASVYQDKQSDECSLPYFASKMVGDCLLKLMGKYSKCNMTVLCGHTHGKIDVQVAKNLQVRAGMAEYRKIFFEIIDI